MFPKKASNLGYTRRCGRTQQLSNLDPSRSGPFLSVPGRGQWNLSSAEVHGFWPQSPLVTSEKKTFSQLVWVKTLEHTGTIVNIPKYHGNFIGF